MKKYVVLVIYVIEKLKKEVSCDLSEIRNEVSAWKLTGSIVTATHMQREKNRGLKNDLHTNWWKYE